MCGGVPERPKGADCKSAGDAYGGSNPPPSTILPSDAYVKPHAPERWMASQLERRMSDVAREEIVFRGWAKSDRLQDGHKKRCKTG